MSGEKSGSVTVDYTTLANSEEKDASALNRLETRREQAEKLSASEEKRLKDLKNRVSRRRQREDVRKRRQAARMEQEIQRELAKYQQRLGQLQEAVRQGANLKQQCPEMNLPRTPVVPEPVRSSIESIRAAVVELENIARDYQKELRSAWVRYQQHQAAGSAAEETRAWATSFRGGAVRTAVEVIAELADLSSLATERHQEVQLNTMAGKAREMLEKAFREFEGGSMELSNELLDALGRVFEAKHESKGMEALENLKSVIDKEKKNQQELRRTELERERISLAEEQREQTQWVAEQIATVLEDLGYTVSGVDETAFVEKGFLYASCESFPDHVMRFELDFNGNGIKSVPLRVVGEGNEIAAEQDSIAREDIDFDSDWCSADRLSSFRTLSAKRGLTIKFKADHPAGTQAVRCIAESELGDTLQEARKDPGQRPAPRTRNSPG